MFDTYVTVVGNVLTAPEWRRTTQSNTLVANFKVASTARRLDRDSGRWVDGNSLRVRVNCWRKLAEGVAASVMVGDPVVVCGRLYTRDWTDDAGNHRTLYELEAVAVGHDLSRGRARFLRNRPSMTTSSVEDVEAESRVHGEPTEPVPDGQAPTLPDARQFDDDLEPPDFGARAGGESRTGAGLDGSLGAGPGRALAGAVDRFAGIGGTDPFDGEADPFAEGTGSRGGAGSFAEGAGSLGAGTGALAEGAGSLGGGAGDDGSPAESASRGTDRTADDDADELAPVTGEPETGDGELDPVPDEPPATSQPAGRGRRGRGRVPQPA
ncbi:single-stranded DNA-binding protein [Micromonospora costi]|uniref:Single-stranded DNA-binding protein n=1 Tax=Micromonospora costi TaxID=1530042 RepID=A0A3A9ZZB3_9ACTN|nr:single-stranded DNA-binding protein [Micromonospora costi]RKN53745.1 single-stranded DNA-binding protein [Micromonospora costi]